MNPIPKLIFFCLLISSPILGQVDSACQNAGFENGTTEGYKLFFGNNANPDDLQLTSLASSEQHELTSYPTDSIINDIIARFSCQDVDLDSLVSQVRAGEYSLRVGNSNGGSGIAKIEWETDVTENSNFLVIHYAVLLQDPGHAHALQAKFDFKVMDSLGNTLPCGNRNVISGPNLEGFLECGIWRVQHWVTEGFDLSAYMGEKIFVEMTTFDCGLQDHGGYAYIDMECTALEMELNNFCDENSTIELVVNPYFDKYLWNTGDTTSQITVTNPIPGTIYTAELISSYGCSIFLSDTIPPIQSFGAPFLNQESDTTICQYSSYWYVPQGNNLTRFFVDDQGEFFDSLLINTLTSREYKIIAKDEYGCKSDTMQFNVEVLPIPLFKSFEITSTICGDNSTGEVIIHMTTNINNQYSLNEGSFQMDSVFVGLSTGTHKIEVINDFGCSTATDSFFLDYISPTEIDNIDITQSNCHELGSMRIKIDHPTSPVKYSLDGINYSIVNNFTSLDSGNYSVYILDGNGCMDSTEVYLPHEMEPIIQNVLIPLADCDNEVGTIEIIADGLGPLTYSLDSVNFQTGNTFNSIGFGNYTIYVMDQNGCISTYSFLLDNLITEIETEQWVCLGQNLFVNPNADPSLTYFWTADNPDWNFNSQSANPIISNITSGGILQVEVSNGTCTTTIEIQINVLDDIILDFEGDSFFCGSAVVSLIANANYNGTYSWQNLSNNSISFGNELVEFLDSTTRFTILFTSEFGCTLLDTVEFVNTEFETDLISSHGNYFCIGESVTLEAIFEGDGSVTWFDNFNTSLGDGNPIDVNPLVETTYFVLITTEHCTSTASITLSPSYLEAELLFPNVTCENDVQLELMILEGDSLTYTFNYNGQSSETTNPIFPLSISDDISGFVTVVNMQGCSLELPFQIIFDQIADLEISADPAGINIGESTQLSTNGEPQWQYQWEPESELNDATLGNPTTENLSSDLTYKVTATTENGCTGIAEIMLELGISECDSSQIFIPNLFTPNADGLNDFFKAESNIVESGNLSIYNRWGEKIFETIEMERGWDGMINGQKLSPDVFLFHFEAKCTNGEVFSKIGSITLMK